MAIGSWQRQRRLHTLRVELARGLHIPAAQWSAVILFSHGMPANCMGTGMANDLQMHANRANALLSTGPASAAGKVQASRNSSKHNLLSGRLVLDDEDPAEFQTLVDDLAASLSPVGVVEVALIERIAVTMWRQRRLVQAETAALNLARQQLPTAKSVTVEMGRGYGNEVKPEHLEPFDSDREKFCRTALTEIEALEEIDLRSISSLAPTVYGQLVSDAEGEPPETFLSGRKDGLTGYIGELMLWCRTEIRKADARPHLLVIADQVRARATVLPGPTLELLSRYQTTMDNQLYKALRALREAQEWRLKSLEPTPATVSGDIADAA